MIDQTKKQFLGKFNSSSTALVLVMLFLLFSFIGITSNWFGSYDWFIKQESFSAFFTEFTHLDIFPIVLIAIPLLGAFFQLLYRNTSSDKRDWAIIFMTFITILITMLMYPVAQEGGIVLAFPEVMGIGISFDVDMLGFTMLLITSVIWFLVMVYAHEYMKKEKNSNRFFLFMAITYSSVLGTIMAGDLLTMFLFFEIMTISSYVLVTQVKKKNLMRLVIISSLWV